MAKQPGAILPLPDCPDQGQVAVQNPCNGHAGARRQRLIWSRLLGVNLGCVLRWIATPPAAAAVRVLALLAILFLIKAALLIQLTPHLFQTHWRVAGDEMTWEGRAAFFLFVILTAGNLWLLARNCQSRGIKAVRIATAAIVIIGSAFIFLTFHNGPNNYLFPIFSGILKWSDLGPYLKLDLFFQQPFLAGWFLAYALCYYVFARTGRERWMLPLAIGLVGVYGCWHLRELALYRDELLAIDTLGLISLVAGLPQKTRVSLPAALMPIFWTCCFAGLLIFHFAPRATPSTYNFFALIAGTAVLFLALALLLKQQGVVSSWGCLVFLFAGFVLLTNHHYPLSQNYVQVLWLGLEFPRYFLGEVFIGLMLVVLAAVGARLFPRLGLAWLDGVNVLLIAEALVDLRINRLLGTRLDWTVVALGNSPKMMWRMARPYLPAALLGIVFLALCYGLLVWTLMTLLRRRGACASVESGVPTSWNSPPINRARRGIFGWSYVLASFFALGFLGAISAIPDKARGQAALRLAASSPWWKTLAGHTPSPRKFFENAAALGITFNAAAASPTNSAPRDLNVVLVFMESTHNEHLSLFGASEETQPLLSQYTNRMELFPNFFSSFASSIHARFATFTSLYPVQDYNTFTLERVPAKSIFEILNEHGYACSMFYSSFADFTGFRDFLKGRQVQLYDADNMPEERKTERVSWGVREEETLGAMREEIRKYAETKQKFFLTYVPAAPHYPYDGVPERFRKFKMTAQGDYTPLYLNDLLYMDWVLASLIDQLKESGLLEKTLVVITDDHGEMLGRNGNPIGHGWWLTPQLANAPLMILDPAAPGYRVNRTVGSQIDLLPTICDRLHIPLPDNQLYQGVSLDAPATATHRLTYLNSFQQYAVLEGNRMFLGDREKDRGSTISGTAYLIGNEGSKPVFTTESAAAKLPVSIGQFDAFQQALLKNYLLYVRAAGAMKTQKNSLVTGITASAAAKTAP